MLLGKRSLLATALGAALVSGCASMWALSELTIRRPPFDENARTESVPRPEVTEWLHVRAYLAGIPPAPPPTGSTAATTTPPPTASGKLELVCSVSQHGRSTEYRAATRYGSSWKKWTLSFFVLEAGLAGLIYAFADLDKTSDKIWLGYIATDAVVTGALALVPSRDVYETTEREDHTAVRDDCPEGVALDLDGREVAVDALGHVDALGPQLFVELMQGAEGGLRLRAGGAAADFELTRADRCSWAWASRRDLTSTLCGPGTSNGRTALEVRVEVAPGTFLGAPADRAVR